MATNFPTNLDSFANPAPTDTLDNLVTPHAAQHDNLNDAVAALEAKVGVTNSAVATSLDKRVNALENAGGSANGNVPDLNGFKMWTADPIHPSGGNDQIMTLGLLYVCAAWSGKAQTITSLGISIGTAGAGGLVYLALYSAAGSLLSQTSSISVSSTGFASGALGAAQAVTAGTKYYIGFWNTTTQARYATPGTSIGVAHVVNSGLTAPNFRMATANGSLATTAPASIGTMTSYGNAPIAAGF
jgi:hypothetical protein